LPIDFTVVEKLYIPVSKNVSFFLGSRLGYFWSFLLRYNTIFNNLDEQARAELGQAQFKLGLAMLAT
jgi:hypothetical protein